MKKLILILISLAIIESMAVTACLASGGIGGSKPGTCDYIAWTCSPQMVGCHIYPMYEPDPAKPGFVRYTEAWKACGRANTPLCYVKNGCTVEQARKAYPYLEI